MIWPALKLKTQSLTWFTIISLKVGDFCVLTLTSPRPSSTPVPSQQPLTHQQHPQGNLNSEQVCSNLTPLHQTVFPQHSLQIPLEAAHYGELLPVQTQYNMCFCSSHMPSRTQSMGFWGGDITLVPLLAHSVAWGVCGHMGPSLPCANRGRHREGTQQSRVSPPLPLLHSGPWA